MAGGLRRCLTGCAALVLTAALAGCGGASDEDQIRSVAATYLAATASADGDAVCDASSTDAIAVVLLYAEAYETEGSSCAEIVSKGGLRIDADELQQAADAIGDARIVIRGGHALVLPTGDHAPTLFAVEQDGDWKIDDFQSGF